MSSFYRRECFGCGQPCNGHHCYSCTCPRCGINLFNGICINCIYGDGKLVTCDVCKGLLWGGFCLSCDLKAENSFICDPNAYSFYETSSNSNYLSQPQYENYLCNLCGNNSHDGYDCQQQFPLVYEQEPSYNQNYNDNYYPHDLPSFPYCDNYDNEDHFVQYKEYLENSSKEIAASNSNQEKEKPPQDFDVRQLVKEECCIEVCEEQKQNMENTMLELVEVCRQKELYCMHDNIDDLIESALNSKLLSINLNSQRLKVKNVMEQPVERRTRIVKSLQNYRVIQKSSTSLENTSHISLVHAIAPILSTIVPEYSFSMGYKHLNTTPETESDEIIKSGVEELVPILNECDVTSEDKRECDMLVCENSPIFDDHSEILSDSNNDDDISSDDDAFEDIEYIEASLPDLEIVSLEEENDVYVEEEEVDLEDIFQIQDVVLREKLLSINRLIANIESLNDNPTPDRVLNSSALIPIFKESDNSLSDNSSPEFETFSDQTEKTRSGSTTTHDSLPKYDSFCFEIEPDQERGHPFFEELLIDDSIPFPNNESFDFEDDLLFPRPPPEPPDADAKFYLEPDAGEEILVVMNDNDELECLDPGGEIDVSTHDEDDDYFPFMFVIRIFLPYLIFPKVFLLPLSAESEDTIFDPEEHIAVQRESKARTTLLQSIPNDHVADFHYMDDARYIWNAVKARFGGNAKSKKMRKSMLKQEFLEFRIGEAEGLHKGYDRMQKILSHLNQLKAKLEDEDILRALPSSWFQVALTLKNKCGLELPSFDDLYYKLKTLEMSYGDSPNYSLNTTYSVPSNSKTGSRRSGNVIEDVLQSFIADTEPKQLAYEDFEQIEKLDLEEMV
nr:ribonuclease H-like domain-containing protein [Tanacetum cinerariifolium]